MDALRSVVRKPSDREPMNDPRNMMDPVIFLEKVRRPVLRGLVRDRLDRRLAELVGPEPSSR